MKATFIDLRRRMREVLRALSRNESVTIFYRGKERAVLVPSNRRSEHLSAGTHPAFGMWADREDMRDVDDFVRANRVVQAEDPACCIVPFQPMQTNGGEARMRRQRRSADSTVPSPTAAQRNKSAHEQNF